MSDRLTENVIIFVVIRTEGYILTPPIPPVKTKLAWCFMLSWWSSEFPSKRTLNQYHYLGDTEFNDLERSHGSQRTLSQNNGDTEVELIR